MNRKIKSVLKQSFKPPLPQHKEIFINSIHYPKTKFSEFIFQQIGFIRKRVWMMFIACLLFAFIYVNAIDMQTNRVAYLSAILPFFVLSTTLEIYKSISFNMDEMELTCKYNLSMITLMRFCVLGVASLFVLIIFIFIVGTKHFNLLRSAIYITVPFLFSNYISLLIIRKIHTKETPYLCAGVCTFISSFMLLTNDVYNYIYNINYTYLWVIAFIFLTISLMQCIIRIIKSQEEIQWNLR